MKRLDGKDEFLINPDFEASGGSQPRDDMRFPPSGSVEPPKQQGGPPDYRSYAPGPGPGADWIGFLRTCLWIYFALIVVVGLIFMFAMLGNPAIALLIFVATVFMALVTVAIGMVFLGMAEDVRRIRALLQKKL